MYYCRHCQENKNVSDSYNVAILSRCIVRLILVTISQHGCGCVYVELRGVGWVFRLCIYNLYQVYNEQKWYEFVMRLK